ncbi:MAG TPA: hypothetical protein VH351_13550 [Bryobacteraceae bacterium]|nr:hypothetical protein [Bryobacteraceae bacterium]
MTTVEIADLAKMSAPAKELARDDLSPSRYVEVLEKQKLFRDAVLFLAYGLPAPLSIRWGCRCCREFLTERQIEEAKVSLEAAETWTESPSDELRWAARDAAEKDGVKTPADLLAMAIFFSGGSVTPPNTPETPPPPYVTQKMTAGSIQVSVLTNTPEKADERYKKALQISRDVVKRTK